MDEQVIDEPVKALLDRAKNATQSHEAMQFTQAALNAAHAAQVLKQIKGSE